MAIKEVRHARTIEGREITEITFACDWGECDNTVTNFNNDYLTDWWSVDGPIPEAIEEPSVHLSFCKLSHLVAFFDPSLTKK